MTYDEHIAEAEACLYRAMSRGTGQERGHPISATAEATIGLLHLGLAAAKPIVTLAPGHGPDEAARAALERIEEDR